MMIVTIEEVRKQCRVTDSSEDDLLILYAESAEQSVLNILNRSIESIAEDYGQFPEPVKHAILLLAAHFYNVREPASTISMSSIPYTFDVLLKPYMIL